MEKTTIQISNRTLERLKMLKVVEKQSYDDILNSLIDNREEESLSNDEIEEIKLGLEDIKKGRLKSIGNIAKELGITLN
jgi:predicted CopG family antitoxin